MIRSFRDNGDRRAVTVGGHRDSPVGRQGSDTTGPPAEPPDVGSATSDERIVRSITGAARAWQRWPSSSPWRRS